MDKPTPLTPEEKKALHDFRERFKSGVKKTRGWHLGAMKQDYHAYNELATRAKLTVPWERINRWPEDERMLTDLYWMIHDEEQKLLRAVKGECPIGWFRPSYEQAQTLNAWHPEYDPDVPDGYRSVLDFSSVRVGKTTSLIINQLLWIGPNNFDWVLYEPYTDHLGREVKIFPRYNWDEWKRSGRRVYDPTEPPKSSCVCWFGCVDENHFNLKIEPNFRKWIPDSWIGRKGKDREWYKADKFFRTKWGHMIAGKLYNSEMSAWSGEELFITSFDEGPPEDKLDETVFRSAYIYFAFTPREAANLGDRSALAFRIWKGDDKERGGYPLIGPKKFFFSKMADAPDHIIPKDVRERRIAIASKMGEAGRVAIEGGFFQSSPLVFSHFDAGFNVLPVDGPCVVRAIRGESYPDEKEQWPWLERFLDANIVRGFDEGIAHPSACTWNAILKTGENVWYRCWSKSSLSIAERCEQIVDLSGNRRLRLFIGGQETEEDYETAMQYGNELMRDKAREAATGQKITRYREKFEREPIRRTFGDSHLFKRDPNCPFDNWSENYSREGLSMERAPTIGPAERCDYVNGLFRPDQTRKHLNPEQGGSTGYGCGLYLTNDLPDLRSDLENYLWQQFTSGPRQGEFTGKPGLVDDDRLDSSAYAVVSKLRWVHPSVYSIQKHLNTKAA